jgi:hypothetical protein
VSVLTNPDGIVGTASRARRGNRDAGENVDGAGAERGFTLDDVAALDRRLGVPVPMRVEPPATGTNSLVHAALAGDR